MSDRLFQRGNVWHAWFYDRAGKRRQVSTRCTDRTAAAAWLAQREREEHGGEEQAIGVPGAPASFVYFVRAGDEGPIKIGRASSPVVRVARLQTGSAARLVVLAVMPGGVQLEAALHAHFARERIEGGEWFAPSKRLLALVAEVSP